jgi:hypothetical protein
MNNNDTPTPTPRTDAAEWFDAMCDPSLVVGSDLARQLERELAVTKEKYGSLKECVQSFLQILRIQEESDGGRVFYPNQYYKK